MGATKRRRDGGGGLSPARRLAREIFAESLRRASGRLPGREHGRRKFPHSLCCFVTHFRAKLCFGWLGIDQACGHYSLARRTAPQFAFSNFKFPISNSPLARRPATEDGLPPHPVQNASLTPPY